MPVSGGLESALFQNLINEGLRHLFALQEGEDEGDEEDSLDFGSLPLEPTQSDR